LSPAQQGSVSVLSLCLTCGHLTFWMCIVPYALHKRRMCRLEPAGFMCSWMRWLPSRIPFCACRWQAPCRVWRCQWSRRRPPRSRSQPCSPARRRHRPPCRRRHAPCRRSQLPLRRKPQRALHQRPHPWGSQPWRRCPRRPRPRPHWQPLRQGLQPWRRRRRVPRPRLRPRARRRCSRQRRRLRPRPWRRRWATILLPACRGSRRAVRVCSMHGGHM